MGTLIKWDLIPKNFNYVGKDENGKVYAYQYKPKWGVTQFLLTETKIGYQSSCAYMRDFMPATHLVAEELPVGKVFCRFDADVTSFEEPDVVNNPEHYSGKVECIDAIEAATAGKTGIQAVCTANVIKYLYRYERKNGIEDVRKAQYYLNKLLAHMEDAAK